MEELQHKGCKLLGWHWATMEVPRALLVQLFMSAGMVYKIVSYHEQGPSTPIVLYCIVSILFSIKEPLW